MRVVADTNVVVSGLLWRGPSRSILDAARAGTINLFTSAVLLSELEEVLGRDKFAARIMAAALTPRLLTLGYAALASLTKPTPIQPVVLDDPDDDFVLACALSAKAEVIVSGDNHLQKLKEHDGIAILSASEFLAQQSQLRSATAPSREEEES